MTLSSCKDDQSLTLNLEEDNGCINKILIPVTSHGTISDSDYSLIQGLFSTNGIVSSNFRYSRTYRDSVVNFDGKFDYRNVYIIQYANGLPIFGESLNYLFKNGVFKSFSGRISKGTALNTSPTLTLGQLRKLFVGDIESFDHKGLQFKDSCLIAEFGYFNLNAGTADTTENIVKAWHLTPKTISYPEAYYQDKNGGLIYYFNGLVSFHH